MITILVTLSLKDRTGSYNGARNPPPPHASPVPANPPNNEGATKADFKTGLAGLLAVDPALYSSHPPPPPTLWDSATYASRCMHAAICPDAIACCGIMRTLLPVCHGTAYAPSWGWDIKFVNTLFSWMLQHYSSVVRNNAVLILMNVQQYLRNKYVYVNHNP